jgi:hypothetical protein
MYIPSLWADGVRKDTGFHKLMLGNTTDTPTLTWPTGGRGLEEGDTVEMCFKTEVTNFGDRIVSDCTTVTFDSATYFTEFTESETELEGENWDFRLPGDSSVGGGELYIQPASSYSGFADREASDIDDSSQVRITWEGFDPSLDPDSPDVFEPVRPDDLQTVYAAVGNDEDGPDIGVAAEMFPKETGENNEIIDENVGEDRLVFFDPIGSEVIADNIDLRNKSSDVEIESDGSGSVTIRAFGYERTYTPSSFIPSSGGFAEASVGSGFRTEATYDAYYVEDIS